MTNRSPLVETFARRMSGAHAAYVFSLCFASAVATVACAGMLAGCTTSGSPQEVSGAAEQMIPRIVTPNTIEATVTAVPLLFDISKGRSSQDSSERRSSL